MKDLISKIQINSIEEAEIILQSEEFSKGRPKTHNVGDVHIFNPNLIWTDLGNGAYAWRSRKYYQNGKYNPKLDPTYKSIDKRVKRRFYHPILTGNLGPEPRVIKKIEWGEKMPKDYIEVDNSNRRRKKKKNKKIKKKGWTRR